MTIRLKCWPDSWDAIVAGEKTAEVRSTKDRTFAVGDIIELERWNPATGAPTLDAGRKMIVAARVTHIHTDAGPLRLWGAADDPVGAYPVAVLSIYVMGPVYE